MRTTVCLSALMLLTGSAWGEGEVLKSGPQVGERLPGSFRPLNITGEFAGVRHCLYCELGPNPVAMIFARGINPEVRALIQRIDAETRKHAGKGMGSFVVFISFDEKLPEQIEKLARQAKIDKTILAVDVPPGPEGYDLARAAEVTVVLYQDHTVRANHAFRKGELNDTAITRIVADISKILPK